MTERAAIERLEFTARFERSFRRLGARRQEQCEKALEQILVSPTPRGLRLKPILPGKIYWEARLNSGDRLILLPEGSVVYVMDVVTHDEIERWGHGR
jgi:mRNA-degrading endonuclease RelE of RelBE toxin-antitoxin system